MGLWVEVKSSLVLRNQIVELAVQHPDNFRAFVVDDGLQFLVPEHRYCESAPIEATGEWYVYHALLTCRYIRALL